jgi:uncharacterized membrane-anchored protein
VNNWLHVKLDSGRLFPRQPLHLCYPYYHKFVNKGMEMKRTLTSGLGAIGLALAVILTPIPTGAKVAPSPVEAPADAAQAEQEAAMAETMAKAKALKPLTGSVSLPEAKATLTIPAGYGFLDASQARTVLVDIWGNPAEQAEGVLGIIMKSGTDFTADESWAAVVTYANEGYVSDKDAADIEPTKLLATLKEGEAEENAARTQEGFPTATIVGWAEPPFYDAATHRIHWAQRLKFGDTDEDTLNYKIRILGREGYLAINFVARMQDLAAVKAATPGVLGMATFNPGSTYADFKEGDKTSGYGLAGLVAGAAAVGAAKKVGLLGLIAAFGKKGIVLLIALGGLILNWVRKLIGRKKEEDLVGAHESDLASEPVATPPPLPENAPRDGV